MAAIVASKVRKQRELSPKHQEELAALAEEHLRKKLAQVNILLVWYQMLCSSLTYEILAFIDF